MNYRPDGPVSSSNIPADTTKLMTQKGTIVTRHGKITLEFLPDVAPKTVMNFCKLANSGFYDHLLFHRIVPGFVIQGGDPNTRRTDNRQLWGTGGPGWT